MSAYLASLGVINGLESIRAVVKFVQMQLFGLLKIAWVSQPLSLLFAQKYLSVETWVPFFSLMSFFLGKQYFPHIESTMQIVTRLFSGTFVNIRVKKQQAALKAKQEAKKEAEEKSKDV